MRLPSHALPFLAAVMLAGLPAAPAPAQEAPQPEPAAAAQVPQGPFALRDLLHTTYQLSFVDVQSCMQILGYLGYNTAPPTGQVELAQLPAVFPVPFKATGTLVGKAADEKATLAEETVAAPENRLMILYHSSQSAELAQLMEALQSTVDVPERQVLIEGMIIELSEDDFKELGVEWKYFGSDYTVSFLPEGDLVPFMYYYNPEVAIPATLVHELRRKLTAVIQEGRAEVLSSPSVLVLNNRNARIQVVQETPILKSKVTFDTTSVDISFEPVGITLNIKPRISYDDSAVTMQIIAEVSAIPAGKGIDIQGTVVAPAIDRRIVETIARVHNNTPFIIGGLIRNETERVLDRIPVLSRIPLLGWLFRRSSTTKARKELIIVLTPRVIKTEGMHRPILPKDTTRFDFLNNRLFRNSYRIKAEDVFDLDFLVNNETLVSAVAQAKNLVARRPELATVSPFRELSQGVIPGEDAVVIRMIYEILQKPVLALHEHLATENIILFERSESSPAGFKVRFLASEDPTRPGLLQAASPDGSVEGYFAREYPKDVLFIRYSLGPDGGLSEALETPVADAEWVTVADRDEVEQRMLEMNRLGDDYRYHQFALVIDRERDLERLKTAIAAREVAKVNDFESILSLQRFRVGRRFVLPELERQRDRIYLIDPLVTEFFYKSDFYYSVLKEQLELGYDLLMREIEKEGM
jgi:general secretion pathway protein D